MPAVDDSTEICNNFTVSTLQTLNEAYKIAQSNQTGLEPVQAWYLATLGAAESLYLEDRIGALPRDTKPIWPFLNKRP